MKTYHKNPRQITKKQYEDLEYSLEKFGDLSGIVHDLNSDECVSGNQRSRIFDILRDKEAPIVITDTFDPPTKQGTVALGYIEWRGERFNYRQVRWSPEWCAEANVRANVSGGGWDWDKLANEFEMGDLLEWGFTEWDFQMAGVALPGDEPPEDPGPQIDKAAELQEKWGTKLGQVWELGEHRLVCGDCTDKAVVEAVMRGERAALCVTSPPYFNQREYSQWKEYADYLDFAKRVINALPMEKDSLIGWNIGSDEQARRWMPSDWWCLFRDDGWLYREAIAWVKSAAVWSVPRSMHIENGHYFPALRWEVILVVSRGSHPKFDQSDRDKVREFQTNVWEFAVVTGNVQKKEGHPAMFPSEIPERFCLAYSRKGSLVFDPFCGSGQSLIACERLGRKCRGIEIEPRYIAVTLERWHQMTGIEPVLVQ